MSKSCQKMAPDQNRDDALMARALYLAATDFGPSRDLQQEMAEVLTRRFPEYDRLYRETDHLNEALSQGMPIKAGGPTREDVTAFLDQRRTVKAAEDKDLSKARDMLLDDPDIIPF